MSAPKSADARGPLRVGVSIHLREGPQTLWENGIFQNCVFLVQLFQRSAAVAGAVLVSPNTVPQPALAADFAAAGVRCIGLDEALETLDVVVEMSSLLPEDWVAVFQQRGGKLAWMRVGNDYVLDIERAMFGLPPAALCSSKKYHGIWTLPEYQRSCVDYFAITTRAPVRIVPHLWTPEFFSRGIRSLPEGVRFGYQPGRTRWRVCTFEPNVSMVKTSITPMLVFEEAYRIRPRAWEAFRVCNTVHLKERPALVRFARSLDIVNHGLATFEGRFAVFEFLAHMGDCVVSHHWENGQNYLYYEALFGDYPLIHNSEFLGECGYYYPEFDCRKGGQALVRAFEEHDAHLETYRAKSRAFLGSLGITHPGNIRAYEEALRDLYKENVGN
jgi:hypothetical protein